MPPSTQAPRSRFTLRGLMVIIAIVAIPLAIVHRAMRMRDAELQRAVLQSQIARNGLEQAKAKDVLRYARHHNDVPEEIKKLERAQDHLQKDGLMLRRRLSELQR